MSKLYLIRVLITFLTLFWLSPLGQTCVLVTTLAVTVCTSDSSSRITLVCSSYVCLYFENALFPASTKLLARIFPRDGMVYTSYSLLVYIAAGLV